MVARRAERDGNLYAGPSCRRAWRGGPSAWPPALSACARATRTSPASGTGRAGVPDRPLRRAVRRHDLRAERYRTAVERTRLFLEGRNASSSRGWSRTCARRPRRSASSTRPTCADAVRTLEQLRHRQQKMSSTRFGDRDALGVKTGPTGSIHPGLPDARRAGDRAASSWWPTPDGPDRVGARRARGGDPQFYAEREVAARDSRGVGAGGGPGARGVAGPARRPQVTSWCRARRTARAAGSGHPQRGDRVPGALRRRRDRELRGPRQAARGAGAAVLPAARRVLRHLHAPGHRHRGLPRGVRGRPDAERAVPQVPDPRRVPPTISPRCARSSRAVTRRLLESGAPHPDLILIDGGKGQLSAAYDALKELGLANSWRSASRRRKS